MKRSNPKFLIGFFYLTLLCTGNICAQASSTPVFDLRNVDVAQGKTIPLDSEWIFYWHQLLSPTDSPVDKGISLSEGLTSWTNLTVDSQSLPSFGYGTYMTKLVLPHRRSSMAIQVPKTYSSSKIWIDDELVFEAGEIGVDAQSTKHYRKTIVIPINSRSDTVTVLIQVANYYHRLGGITKPVMYGETYDLWQKDRLIIMSDMILVGSLMFIGFSFMILFYAYWNMDRAILYFSIFCLCWGYRTLSEGYAPLPYLFDGFPWQVHVKIEYMSLFLGALAGSLFINAIFRDYLHILYPRMNSWLAWSLIVLSVVLPDIYLSYLLPPFFVLISINIAYVVIRLVQIKKKGFESIMALIGILSGLLVLSYHIFTFNILGVTNTVVISIGYVFVFMINSLILGKRFSVSFRSLKSLEQHTRVQNKAITYQAEELNKVNDLLEEKVTERTHELQKVAEDLKIRNINLEQFNYIISHNMRAPVSNLTGLLKVYNYNDANDPFNKVTMEHLTKTTDQLDAVLRDLTTILEVKYRERAFELIVLDTLVRKIRLSVEEDIKKYDVTFDLTFEVVGIKSVSSFWYSILYNLISNAIKYRKSDSPCQIKIGTVEKNGKTVLTFEDNGMGIDLVQNKDKIFGLYKRFHTHVEGKGMGLFMVKAQVESMGGSITIESEPNKGCKFVIVLS